MQNSLFSFIIVLYTKILKNIRFPMASFPESKKVYQERPNGTTGWIATEDIQQLLVTVDRSETFSITAVAAMENVNWMMGQIQFQMKGKGEFRSTNDQDGTIAAIHVIRASEIAVQKVNEAIDQMWTMAQDVIRMSAAFQASIEEAKGMERGARAVSIAFGAILEDLPVEMSPQVTSWSQTIVMVQSMRTTWQEASNSVETMILRIHEAMDNGVVDQSTPYFDETEVVAAIQIAIQAVTMAKEKVVAAVKSFDMARDQIYSTV
jgi:hypothetical protein